MASRDGHGRRPAPRKVGDTIRCAPARHPDYVRRLLRFLEQVGFEAAPRFHGIDETGADILDFVEGTTPEGLNWGRWSDAELSAAFRLLRRLHDTTAGTIFAEQSEVACHNDFAPPNLVFRDGLPVAIIDWEWAAPGSRRRDLAHAIWQWTNFRDGGVLEDEQVPRVSLILDAYGVDPYAGLTSDILGRQDDWLALARRGAEGGINFLGRSPSHWAGVHDWVAAERRWWAEHGSAIEAALRARPVW